MGPHGQFLPPLDGAKANLSLCIPFCEKNPEIYQDKNFKISQVSQSDADSCTFADADSISDIFLMEWDDIKLLYNTNNMQAYLIDWSDLEDKNTDKPLVGAVIRGVLMRKFTENNLLELPKKYSDLKNVFSKINADKFSPHSKYNMAIEMPEGEISPFRPIYNLSKIEIGVLKAYIEEMQEKSFITPLKSPAKAPMMFVKKKNGGLCFCVDYQCFNARTTTNKHPWPLIQMVLNMLRGAKLFTKIDIIAAYHAICIRAGDEWKIAFCYQYGHFQYRVVLFGLVNVPALFQALINLALCEFLDNFEVAYLDDIVIYSQTEEEHILHVQKVLQKLALFVKLSKCVFRVVKIKCLGFLVSMNDILMDLAQVNSVFLWLVPSLFWGVQVFLRFANFCRQFIEGFSRVRAVLWIY